MEHQNTRRSRAGPWHYPPSGTEVDRQNKPHALARFARGADRADHVARLLGWVGIGVGMAALLLPRTLAQAVGASAAPTTLLRAIGLRDLVCGIGLLKRRNSPLWRWSPVVGGAMDLSLLGFAARTPGVRRTRLATVAVAVAGVIALGVMTVQRQGGDA